MKGLQRHPDGMRDFLEASFGVELGLSGQSSKGRAFIRGRKTVQQGDACEAEGLRGGRDSGRAKCSLSESLRWGFTAQRRKEGRDSADKEKLIGLRSAKEKGSKQKHHSRTESVKLRKEKQKNMHLNGHQ